ncbi:hypothetical protein [Paraburkholderia lacunae]|uniref:hypothetical protein n=1 Tax=Paraburkholderia lacunae TaxID=2211104 RepID=UPI003CC5D715
MIDEEIAHIERVMRPSLCGFEGGPILPAEYWRRRLHQLLDSYHLTKVQLCSIDSLLLQLNRFDAGEPVEPSRRRRNTASGGKPKTAPPGYRGRRCDSGKTERRVDSAASRPALPSETATKPTTHAHIDAPYSQIANGATAKAQKPAVSVAAAGMPPRRPLTGTHTHLYLVTPTGNPANQRHLAEPPSPIDEADRWDASLSLAVAVQELLEDGLAATLKAVSAGHVLLGVHAMRLAQISGFEVWRDGITQQLHTKRLYAPYAPAIEDPVTQPECVE